MTTTAATKATIADIQKSSRKRTAALKAELEAAIERENAFVADLIAEAIKADDPVAARDEWMAAATSAPTIDRINAAALLPTGERMNPSDPSGAVYFDKDQTAYIVRKVGSTKASRVYTSFGGVLPGWTLGSQHVIKHDQTWVSLGTVVVVGIVEYASGLEVGDVPNRSLAHSVFK